MGKHQTMASAKEAGIDSNGVESLDDSILAAALHSLCDAVVITRADWGDTGPTVVYVNPAFIQMTGYSPSQIIGKSYSILYGPKTDQRVLAELRKQLEQGQVLECRAVHYRKDGSEFINEYHVQPIPLSAGQPRYFLIVQRDVTLRQKAQEELLEHKRSLEQKNAALREVLELIEIEKKKLRENVSTNVEGVVLPALSRLSRSRTSREKKYLGIIQEHLKDLTSTFGAHMSQPSHRLSPRELQIANLVKSGLSSKDIASSLGISIKTVETIRNKIRRKLGLVNRDVNLISYFRNS